MALSEDSVSTKAWGAGLLSWAIPGLGHFYLGRYLKGALLGGIIWSLFFFGIYLGGHLYGLMDSSFGFLSYVFALFDLGNGLAYLVSRFLGFATTEQPHLSTAEYGNVLIMCSGLLNYLLSLDTYDIASGRKT